jgi:uncharacterized membrane protein YccC
VADGPSQAGADRRFSPWFAAAIIYVVMAAVTAMVWGWSSLPAAVALGVGFTEIAPIRRDRGSRVALGATLVAAVVIVISGAVNDTVLGYSLLVAIAAFGAGFSSRWGLYSATVLTPLVLVILSTAPTPAAALPRAVALGIGALLGTVLLGILRLDPPTSDRTVANRDALLIGATLGIVVGAAVWLTATYEVYQGHWITITILSIAVPSLAATQGRSVARTAATVAGAAIAAVATSVVPSGQIVIAVALLAAVASAALVSDYSWRITLLTISVILYAGGGEDSQTAAVARVIATLVGALVVVACTWFLMVMDRRLAQRQVSVPGTAAAQGGPS